MLTEYMPLSLEPAGPVHLEIDTSEQMEALATAHMRYLDVVYV